MEASLTNTKRRGLGELQVGERGFGREAEGMVGPHPFPHTCPVLLFPLAVPHMSFYNRRLIM